jgi:hypothetical protein
LQTSRTSSQSSTQPTSSRHSFTGKHKHLIPHVVRVAARSWSYAWHSNDTTSSVLCCVAASSASACTSLSGRALPPLLQQAIWNSAAEHLVLQGQADEEPPVP